MFWKILMGAAKAAFHINRTVTALGAATIIVIGVHDYLKNRGQNRFR
jgi:hypothetical protein